MVNEINSELLRPNTMVADVETACNTAKEAGAGSVCVPLLFIVIAKKMLEGSAVKVAAAIGYPYGYSPTEVKLSELMLAMLDGADEVYLTANTMAIKNNDWHYIAKEFSQILPVVHSKNKVMKTLVDTSMLTSEEIQKCGKLIEPAGIEVVGF